MYIPEMPTRFLMPAAAAAAASVELRHSPAACAQWLHSRSLLRHRLRPPRPPSGGVCGTPETAIATAVSASEARTQAQDSPGRCEGQEGGGGHLLDCHDVMRFVRGAGLKNTLARGPVPPCLHVQALLLLPTVPRVSARPFRSPGLQHRGFGATSSIVTLPCRRSKSGFSPDHWQPMAPKSSDERVQRWRRRAQMEECDLTAAAQQPASFPA
jgi:hypothetical protein